MAVSLIERRVYGIHRLQQYLTVTPGTVTAQYTAASLPEYFRSLISVPEYFWPYSSFQNTFDRILLQRILLIPIYLSEYSEYTPKSRLSLALSNILPLPEFFWPLSSFSEYFDCSFLSLSLSYFWFPTPFSEYLDHLFLSQNIWQYISSLEYFWSVISYYH